VGEDSAALRPLLIDDWTVTMRAYCCIYRIRNTVVTLFVGRVMMRRKRSRRRTEGARLRNWLYLLTAPMP